MSTYRIIFADGDAPLDIDGWLNVEPTLATKYGHAVEIGHDGDLSDGGDRTLFWASAEDAEDDNGARAMGWIQRMGEEVRS